MKQKSKVYFLIIFLFIIPICFSNNLTEYEYHTKVNVECNEYIGYVEFDLPKEFDSIQNPSIYSNVDDFYLQKSHDIVNYQKHNNWYANKISGFDVLEIEKLTDNNYNNYLLADNKNQINITLENPEKKNINRIKIDIKDTVIDNIELYDRSGKEINFKLKKELFTYYLDLENSINTKKINIIFNFDELLKIKEIGFYDKVINSVNSKIFFKVENNCKDTFDFYFGEFGKSNSKKYYNQDLVKKQFNVLIENNKNSLYNNDFDNDGILNNQDNCIKVSNVDQKDINYNNIGDACEDNDNDGILNNQDNCIDKYNKNQLDNDNDGIGNSCDNKDDRFFEKNKIYIYIGIVLVCLLFVFLSVKLLKK